MFFGGGDFTRVQRANDKEEKKPTFTSIEHEHSETDLCSLSMYLQPDTGIISLEQFQAMGLKRLAVLRKLETLKEKFGDSLDDYKRAFREEIGVLMPLATNSCVNSNLNEARREDRISHFILRLAFCQIPEQIDWFVRMETELFRLRLQNETKKNLAYFLTSSGIKLHLVDKSEREQFTDELGQALSLTAEEMEKTDLYKVDFVDVLDLLSSHRVLLKEGTAYISSNELFALVIPRFRDNIFASMSRARKEIGFLQENDRLLPLLRNMVQCGEMHQKEFSDFTLSICGFIFCQFSDPNTEQITSDMVDALAQSSFPLCMRQIHAVLRREHHLRHFARRQFGLFLKGIGLSLEGSLEFFRSEFTKKMDAEKFSKEYAYNIRHMYGKEGNRIDQKPLSCASIILGSLPTSQDCHGCPFKHSDAIHLGNQLAAIGLNDDQITHILELSKIQRFDKACTKYFEYTHNVPDLEELITHPNQFYNISRKVRRGDFFSRKNYSEEEENME